MESERAWLERAGAWIGLPAPEAIARMLVADESIARISLTATPSETRVQERPGFDRSWTPLLTEALEMRDQLGVPFWDAVMELSKKGPIPDELRREAFHHNPTENRESISVSRLTPNLIRSKANELPPGRVLALSSEVECRDGERRHIPMLDFRWSPTSHNQALVKTLLSDLSVVGLLVNSGNSFHFYGRELLTWEDCVRFLGMALLCGPMIDRRWIAHQLIEGVCTLRVSKHRDDHGLEPTVVGLVGL